MSIRQTPEGKWYYRFQYKGVDCCEGGFRTQDQAARAEVKAKDKVIRDEIHPERAADEITFAEAGELFFERYGKKKRSGLDDQYRIRLMGGRFGERKLREISANVVEDCLDALQAAQGFSDHSWNHYLANVKMVFNYLKKKRLYDRENPADTVSIKRVPRARVRFLYPNEEKMLTPEVFKDAVLWPYYYVALHTGMRLSELSRIQVKDVMLAIRQIFIPYAKNSRSRYVPMSEDLAKFLEPLLKNKGEAQNLLPCLTSAYIGRRFNRLCKTIGLKNFKFHDLRHSFAQNLLSKGEPIYKVSKILGHCGVQVTEQHYGHLSMADLQSAVDKIDGVVKWPSEAAAMELQWPKAEALKSV